MADYPKPKTEGFYWAIWTSCATGTADEDCWVSSGEWEPVEVWLNGHDPVEDEYLMVFVGGVQRGQLLTNFKWGPAIARPKELT